jgi:hypothetical protein
MTARNGTTLKGYFNFHDVPSESNFADLVDSLYAGPALLIAASNSRAVDIARADYVCDGTNDEEQLQAAHDALPATGGLLRLCGGTYNIQSTGVAISKPGVDLRGASKNATKITSALATAALTVDIGVDATICQFGFSDFWLSLLGNGDGIQLNHNRSNYGEIKRLHVTGGVTTAWAINSLGTNVTHLADIYMQCHCNGIVYQSVPGGDPDYNWGDSIFQHIEIAMLEATTTGIKIAGPDNSDKKVNNVLISQVEVTGQGNESSNVGMHLRNCSRISLDHVDLENLGTGLLHESGQDGGAVNEANAFIQVFAINCGDDYSEVGSPTHLTIIGGDGELQSMQQLAGTSIS